MYTATVTVGATATSIRDLVNTAVPGEIPTPAFTGRCYQVTLLPLTGSTASISSRGGLVAGIDADNFVLLPANVPFVFQSPTGNQISIDEIFLSGGGTVGVMILVL
jgi:hypothetical protein